MNNIFVYIELENGAVADVSLELLTKGRELADTLKVKLEAVAIGERLAGLEKELARYGADTVWVADDKIFAPFRTLPHTAVMCGLVEQGGQGMLVGPGMTVTAVHNGPLELEGETGRTLSIFCLGEPAQGVTLEGLKYPLHGATMTVQVPLGVSNEFLGGPARITVERGTLVVMIENQV